MNEAECTKIMRLYESHLQVKKLSSPGTVRLYLHSVQMFIRFCNKFQQDLVLPEQWEIHNIGVRELEAFLQHQMDIKKMAKKYSGNMCQRNKKFPGVFNRVTTSWQQSNSAF